MLCISCITKKIDSFSSREVLYTSIRQPPTQVVENIGYLQNERNKFVLPCHSTHNLEILVNHRQAKMVMLYRTTAVEAFSSQLVGNSAEVVVAAVGFLLIPCYSLSSRLHGFQWLRSVGGS